jgi:RNA polymerase sigma-70 factor (ECF subfamily)
MYRVALNTSIAHLNQQKKKGHSVSLDLELLNRSDPATSAGSEWEERMDILYAHIKQLNVIEKGLILLFLEGKSYEEIASISGFTTTNVGTRLGRIKEKLRTNIKK